ncbi:MAG: DUF2130 domain-containing protein [Oscillospiraceae bacterium]|nr:DUF2130 domain-containing protein [Oscillospiraceae bacterium]
MNTSNITCPYCKKPFEISDALQKQIADELQKQKDAQSETLRKEYENRNRQAVKDAVDAALNAHKQQSDAEANKLKLQLELALQKAKDDTQLALEKQRLQSDGEAAKLKAQLELAEEKAKNAAELARDTEKQRAELENAKLLSQIEAEKESNKSFKERLNEALAQLSKSEKDKEAAEIKAREHIREREREIREEAVKKANEDNFTKIREQEETILKLNRQLTEAKQVAEQGSQQLQGEILELDIENALIVNFKFDTITEVKKGEYGADIRQIINDFTVPNCGLILWECKNAKNRSDKWTDKLKEEVIGEKAQAGIIVWYSPNNTDDFKQISDNIWLVKPQYAVMLGFLIRDTIIKVGFANRNNENKAAKTEMLYNYLMGDEFKNRFQTIITAYTDMQSSQKKERAKIMKMWAEQDKLIDVIQYNLIGMSGDMKGIAGKEIIALPDFGDNRLR